MNNTVALMCSNWALRSGCAVPSNDQEGVGYHAFAVDANVHYLFPLEQYDRVTPYALGGIGFVRTTVSASSVLLPGFDVDTSDNAIGLNLGGGVRLDLNERWSVRPELRALIADGSHVRLSVGMLYAFGR